MYRDHTEDAITNPVFSCGSFPSEEQLMSMIQDDADGVRCEQAVTEAELVELYTMMNPAPVAAPSGDAITIGTYVDVHGKHFKAGVTLNGRKVKCPGTFRVEQDAWDAAQSLANRYTINVDVTGPLARSLQLSRKTA